MSGSIERISQWVVLVTIVVLGAFSILAAKALLADGSYAMLGILERRGYWDIDRARAFAMTITQTPVVLAIKAGERDVITLIYAFSLGLVGTPILLWAAALMMQWRSDVFWVIVVAFCVTHLTSGFCSIGEYNTAYALTAFCFSAMLRPRIGPWTMVGLLLAACALVRSYESTAYLGPLLAVIAVDRLRGGVGRPTRAERAALIAALVLFAVGTAIAGRSIAHPRDPGNLSNAANFSWMLTSPHIVLVLLMGMMYVTVDMCPPRVKGIVIAAGIVLSAVYLAWPDLWNAADQSYFSRTASGLLLGALLAVEWFRRRRTGSRESCRAGSRAVLAMLLFVAVVIPAFVQTYWFGGWLKTYERVAVASPTWIPIDQTVAGQGGGYLAGLNWGWTSPSLSIVLRANADGGLLNSPLYTGWDPFDPRALPSNPVRAFRRDGELLGLGIW